MLAMTWTAVIATYAAIVSTGSLVVAVLAWRSAGPRLKVRGWFYPAEYAKDGTDTDKPALRVENRGRADVEVNSIYGVLKRVDKAERVVQGVMMDFGVEEGPSLPHRLLAHSSA